MDSGNNSASLQSSSGGGCGGGDEEYDSRAAVANSFSSANFDTQNTSMFDPFANYFNPISRQQQQPLTPSLNYPASLFNLDTDWSKTLRSDHNNSPHQINNSPMSLLASSNKSFSNSLSFGDGVSNFPSAVAEHGGGSMTITTTTTTEPAAMAAAVQPADQPVMQPAVRNPKKRSRASRRAPTTVLTTDTTNFRAMVQEFTGIPAPPFTSSTYFHPRSRFDIFGATPNSSLRPPLNISQQQPNYLRRPFPQKIQPQQPGSTPFLSPSPSPSPSSSSSSALLSCLAKNIASASTTSAANDIPQSCNIFTNIQQNSILTSLLQSSQKYPLESSNILGSKDQEQFQIPSSSKDSQLKMGSVVLEDYGMSSHNLGHNSSGLPNLISPEQAATTRNQNNIIHGDKVQEMVGSRGEGMVESWINSSH